MLSATGTGKKRTIPALLDSPICRVTVAQGRDTTKLTEISRLAPQVRVTTDLQEFALWKDDYDIVYVASPPFLHTEQVRFALSLEKPIVCEKPLVANRDDLGEMTALLRDSVKPVMVAHHLRHQPVVGKLQEILKEEQLGPVSSAALQWSFWLNHEAPSATWKLDPRRGGSNAMFDAGVHALDLALCLFGVPGRISALGARRREVERLDTVSAHLGYDHSIVTIMASQAGSTDANDLVINFAEGAVKVPAMFGERSARTLEIHSNDGRLEETFSPVNLYGAEVEDFCRHLQGESLIGTSIRDGLESARILFAIEDALSDSAGDT
ncbi:hypothetical protein GCM10027176_36870 [Actinoallomurus bryophytorum]|uniref:Putative dehydrogenase n=2 Tax=Actinoallomurus bryophytorum TaxID=1490222 RepID=A0A543CIU1_9ACTN|nr:putative dehydrogenase [Actinoallomurus bryophytorum]